MRITGRYVIPALWFAVLCSSVSAQLVLHSGTFGGGGNASTNGQSLMAGTIGQTLIGPSTNSSNMLGLGFWYTLPLQPISSVLVDPGMAGSGVALHQNVPNPFSATTTIAFDMPNSGYVSLKLFDGIGREVRTLVDGVREAGRTTVTVDADRLESGSYTARLLTQNIARTITLVVVR